MSRHGLQFGAPKHGYARAVTRMHAMQRQEAARRNAQSYRASSAAVASPALSGAWNLLGPFPMSEKANYTGNAVGANQPMTGRMTSVAADARGVIVAGAASGGLWLSTNNGGSFAPVFDGQTTEAIGAIALDTTTNPSTIYVGTGEGNNSIDSLYGSGIYKSTDLGQHWTSLATGTFERAAFTSMAIDTTTTPGKAAYLCRHHQWI